MPVPKGTPNPKVAKTMYKRYGSDYYHRIGKLGGRAGGAKGFAAMDPERASLAGQLGGLYSRRTGRIAPEKLPRAMDLHLRLHGTLDGLDTSEY